MLTALFFGSFNPVHVGHLMIAETVADLDEVGEVWLVVSPHNPLKEPSVLMDDDERLRLARRAVAGNPRLGVCDIEMRLPRPSYTINTLDALRREHPDREFALVIGGDNLALFTQWRDYEKILDRYPIYVYPRPGSALPPLAQRPSVRMVSAPMLDISSTLVRQRLAAGKSVRYMLTEPVYDSLTGGRT